jgi:arginase
VSAALTVPVLLLPQWQGYTVDDRPARGARAIAAALDARERLHEIDVAPWHDLARITDTHGEQIRILGLHEIAAQAGTALRWLYATAPARLLVIGGDCGSDLAPLAWQAARFGDQLGVLYLDAHADLNTPASSPSGRFHGMVLRAALGDSAAPLAALCPRPLRPDQLVLAGTRDLDPPERAFLDAARIQPWPASAFGDGSLLAALLAHRATRWHVHLDLDVLDPADFPDVTVPVAGGPSLDTVVRLLAELISQRDVVSIAVTEHVGGEPSARRIADALTALHRGWR